MQKLVYVSLSLPGDGVISVDDLNTLLSDGWAVAERKTEKRLFGRKKKEVDAILLVKSDGDGSERGIVRHRHSQHAEGDDNAIISNHGRGRGQGPRGPLMGSNSEGYLGSSLAHIIPGAQVVNQFSIAAAEGLGADNARTGTPLGQSPFPAGSVPRIKWVGGWLRATPRPKWPPHMQQAAHDGASAGASTKDSVTSPYASSSDEQVAWLMGFIEAGGTVEGGG